MADLRPGTYRLSQDVKNPKPDRRHRYKFEKWETWEKGTLLVVSDQGPPPDLGLPNIEVLVISRPGRHDNVRLKTEAGQLLAAHLVPVEEQPSDWLKREHSLGSGASILDYLVKTGKLTLAEVQSAYVATCAKEPE